MAAGLVVVGLTLSGCGSGSGKPAANPTSALSAALSATSTAPANSIKTKTKTKTKAGSTSATTPGSTAAVPEGAAVCPTQAQADAALGVPDSGPISTATPGGGVVCEYSGAGGNAAVAIFAHQSAAVFAGQVAHAPGAPAMAKISGVGDGAFGMTTAGRSIVNAYSDASRTNVAAQAPGALSPVEALARIALADN